MQASESPTQHPLTAKPHFANLDGLRGVAAVMVVAFHLLETHATGHHDQIINHGYLAVDFFFILSGFVIGYAYDDRWSRMSLKNFALRRLIRLQPMVVLGTLIGAALFYFQAGPLWPAVGDTSVTMLLFAVLMGCLMLPLPVGLDIRGWQETYPLNGPAWSLFFEYCANIAYALLLRRLPTWLLALVAVAAAGVTTHYLVTVPSGDFIGGWALTGHELYVGFTRLAYPITAGLLIARWRPRIRLPHPFLACSLFLVALLAVPRIGGENVLLNGIYDLVCVVVFFPLIIIVGSTALNVEQESSFACRFLGRISYPLYITHFPLACVYYSYVHAADPPSWAGKIGWGVAVWLGSIALAYVYTRFYDEPVRRRLMQRLMARRNP